MKPTVLVVEDDLLTAMALRHIFQNLGLRVIGPARSCEEAISAARQSNPDLVVMDIDLEGDRNGLEAAELIREFSPVPIVFQSSSDETLFLQRAMRLSQTLFINKTTSKADWRLAIGILNTHFRGLVA